MTTAFADWIGRSETRSDRADPRAYARLAALLSDEPAPWPEGTAPRLGHWLNFAEDRPLSALGADGHPAPGGFMPPVGLPRRMWAGSRIVFHAPILEGRQIERRSTILEVAAKTGRSGEMAFVRVGREVFQDARPVLSEEQDIVYRAAAPPAPAAESQGPGPEDPRSALFESRVTPDPVMLFRYSALTWNSHRIHYDADYAREAEGYPGLVVQGPLTATLLLDLLERAQRGIVLKGFSFRARAPLFAGRPIRLGGVPRAGGYALFAEDEAGRLAMTAEADVA
jgi:3-methylfumaryl-CoA hydratase